MEWPWENGPVAANGPREEDRVGRIEPAVLGPVLVLATSGPAAEVGLRSGRGAPLVTRALGAGAARGRGLLPAVQALLAEAGLAPLDLTAIAADVGPGSFTGVRVGVTAANALAWALRIPALGVLSLDALARAAPPDAEVLALRDAGRGTVYAALYGPARDGRRAVLHAPARVEGAALASWTTSALLVGEEAPRLCAAAGLGLRTAVVTADVAAVLAEAGGRLSAGGAGEPIPLVPLYLQASAPERLAAGEAGPPHPPAPGDRSPPA